jgi:hypothetical protein
MTYSYYRQLHYIYATLLLIVGEKGVDITQVIMQLFSVIFTQSFLLDLRFFDVQVGPDRFNDLSIESDVTWISVVDNRIENLKDGLAPRFALSANGRMRVDSVLGNHRRKPARGTRYYFTPKHRTPYNGNSNVGLLESAKEPYQP